MDKLGIFLLLLIMIFGWDAHAQIPREDILECGLSDGSKFILKSTYIWYPVNPNPRSTLKRSRNSDFGIFFEKRNSLKSLHLNGKFSGQYLQTNEQAENLCAYLSSFKNNAYSPDEVIKVSNSQIFTIPNSKYRYLSIFEKSQSLKEKNMLEAYSVQPFGTGVIVIKDNGEFISEQPLYDSKIEKVEAVYRSISHDQGQTWLPGEVTKNTEIFELGKSLLEQCFIARPIAMNGKKIDSKFPPCRSDKK